MKTSTTTMTVSTLLDVDDEEEWDEEKQMRSTFTLLVEMKPLLGELMGGSSAAKTIPVD